MFPASQQVLTRPLAVEGEAAIPQVISTMQVCTMRDVLTTPAPAYMLCRAPSQYIGMGTPWLLACKHLLVSVTSVC